MMSQAGRVGCPRGSPYLGQVGILVFGLQHPTWILQEEVFARDSSANGVSLADHLFSFANHLNLSLAGVSLAANTNCNYASNGWRMNDAPWHRPPANIGTSAHFES